VGSRVALDILEKKKFLAATEIRTLDCLAHSTVTTQTVPSQSLPLQVIYGYVHKWSAEINYISFKIIC